MFNDARRRQKMKASNRMQRVLFRSVVALAVIALLAVVYSASENSTPVVPLPNPNAYDDFLAAGKMLQGDWPDWTNTDMRYVRGYLETNRPALELVDRGLSRKSQAPIEFSKSFLGSEGMQALSGSKRLAMALRTRGKLAETEGRFGDAASNYADIITLGIEMERGGLLIHCLVQIAIEAIGTRRLEAIVPDLDARESLRCVQALAKEVAARDSFDNFRHQERSFYFHTLLTGNPFEIPSELGELRFRNANEKSAEAMYRGSEHSILRLEIHLAEHAFELEKGRAATNWNDLVPSYLASIPNDPTTNRPIAFDSW